jgi:hypothetical protein
MHVIHRLWKLSGPPHEVIQSGFARVLGLFQCSKGRTGDPDRTHIHARHRTPRSNIAGLPTEAGPGPALVADHEREAVAYRAPYFHVGDEIADPVEREINRWRALVQ